MVKDISFRTIDWNGCSEPRIKELLGPYELGLLNPEERIAVEQHVLQCDSCFEDLYETAPLSSLPRRKPAQRRTRARRWYIPAAAAAVVILAFTFTLRGPDHDIEPMRGIHRGMGKIELRGPGAVIEDGRIVFSWKPGEFLSRYTVLVFDEEGNTVWSGETTGGEEVLPLDEGRIFRPGKTYYWKVVGRNESGTFETGSAVHTFSLSESRH